MQDIIFLCDSYLKGLSHEADWNLVDILYMCCADLSLKKCSGRFLNFQMLQFQKKNIVIFLAVNAKPTPLDMYFFIIFSF
jgi:hypothetical protein